MSILRKRHSGLPTLPSHFIRLIQLITSSILIAVILWLHQNLAYKNEPSIGRQTIRELEAMWGWRTIFVASIVTSATVAIMTILHLFHRLSIWTNLSANLILLLTWTAGFCGLWKCTISHEILTLCDDTSPCQIYNVVFACDCLALVTTGLAVILDIEVSTRRRKTKYEYLLSSKRAEIMDTEALLYSPIQIHSQKQFGLDSLQSARIQYPASTISVPKSPRT